MHFHLPNTSRQYFTNFLQVFSSSLRRFDPTTENLQVNKFSSLFTVTVLDGEGLKINFSDGFFSSSLKIINSMLKLVLFCSVLIAKLNLKDLLALLRNIYCLLTAETVDVNYFLYCYKPSFYCYICVFIYLYHICCILKHVCPTYFVI